MQAAFDLFSGRRQRLRPCAIADSFAQSLPLQSNLPLRPPLHIGHLSTTASFWRTVHTLTQRPLPFVPMVERFKRKNIQFSARFLLLPACPVFQWHDRGLYGEESAKRTDFELNSYGVFDFNQAVLVWGIGRISWRQSLQRNPAKPTREFFSRPIARFVGSAAKILAGYPKTNKAAHRLAVKYNEYFSGKTCNAFFGPLSSFKGSLLSLGTLGVLSVLPLLI